MACAVGVRHTGERLGQIVRGSTSELAAKCAGEHGVAGKPNGDRYSQHGLVAGQEPGGRACETQTLRMLPWRLTAKPAERAVQVRSRPTGASRQGLQREVLVEVSPHGAQQVKVVGAH